MPSWHALRCLRKLKAETGRLLPVAVRVAPCGLKRQAEGVKEMRDELSRSIFIDCCKDRTLTYRHRSKKTFNNIAIPVFSVDDEETAQKLIRMVGRLQYQEHPKLPNQGWFKVTLDGELDFKAFLDIEDLEAVTYKLAKVFSLIEA